MKKSIAAVSKQTVIVAAAAAFFSLQMWSAEKTSYTSGSGLSPATWTPLPGTGTIVNDGTDLITGTGTAFVTEVAVGSIIRVNSVTIGTVASITNDTSLHLGAPTLSGFGAWEFTHQTVPFTTDNVTIAAGHDVTILGAPGLTVHDVTIHGTATMTSDCPALNITGSLLNNGTFIQEAGCRLIMDGAASTIGGSSTPVTIRSLRVKTTIDPAAVTLNAPVVVTDLLDIQDGTINLNGQTLTVGAGTGTAGTLLLHDGTYESINGPGTLTRWFAAGGVAIPAAAGAFPLSAGGVNRHVWIGGTVTQGGTVSMTITEDAGTTPISVSENFTTFDKRMNIAWAVSVGDGLLASPMSLRIQASGLSGYSALSDLTMSGAAGAANGVFGATTNTLPDPQVNRTLTDQGALAGTYYIAASEGSPMPVELSSFTAAAKDGTIVLQWNTATERNNFGFEIERRAKSAAAGASAHGWTKIGFAEGHGTTGTPQSYRFADNGAAGSYAYRLKQIDRDGRFEYSNEVEAVSALHASAYALTQNYPNPFNPSTNIRFMVASTQQAALTVYDVLGREAATLFDGTAEGNVMQSVVFDASGLASGMYFYMLRANGKMEVRKMQLLR